MPDIILFGPPGSGKGTQASRIKGYRHVSTGSLFRQAVADQTDLGKEIEEILGTGTLIPDNITLRVVEEICFEEQDIVWDGFPRSLGQAVAFDDIVRRYGRNIGHIISLIVPEDVLLQRVLDRAEGRADDNEETFRIRHRIYESQSTPILKHYGDRVTEIDGTLSVAKVAAKIAKLIK